MSGKKILRWEKPSRFLAWYCGAVSAPAFAYLLARGCVIEPDSAGYLQAAVTRGALYPAFLEICRAAFGGGYLFWVVFVQLSAVLGAAAFFTLALNRRARLPAAMCAVVHALALSPLFKLPLGLSFIGNAVLTEALAYGAWLALAGLGVLFFFAPSAKKLAGCAALAAFLAALRPQFLFMYPLAAIAAALLVYARKATWRMIIASALCLAVCAAAGVFTERAWHKAKHGLFIGGQMAWTQMLVPALYLSQESDSSLYTAAGDRELFSLIFGRLDKAGYNAAYRQRSNLPLSSHFTHLFDALRISALDEIRSAQLDRPLSQAGEAAELNSIARRLAVPLLRFHWKQVLKLTAAEYVSYVPPYCAWTFMLLLIWAALDFAKNRGFAALFLILTIFAAFLNAGVSSISTVLYIRYTFYTEILLAAAVLIFAGSRAGAAD